MSDKAKHTTWYCVGYIITVETLYTDRIEGRRILLENKTDLFFMVQYILLMHFSYQAKEVRKPYSKVV